MTLVETYNPVEGDLPPIVESCLHEVRDVATLPAVALNILRLVQDADSTVKDAEKIIAGDPSLSIRILKVANSSFYGLSQQVGSIDRAILLLGFNSVKNIALAASLHKLFRAERISPHFDARDLWTHSVAVATAARALAKTTGLLLGEDAFLAGLIHDVGIMIEMQACRRKFVTVIETLAGESSSTFRRAEEAVLGATHETFGIALCRKWRFPKSLENVAGFHHRPMQLPKSDRIPPAIVHVADILAARLGLGYTRTAETDLVDRQVLDTLGLGPDVLEAVSESLPGAIQETQQLFAG